jgi:anti-sigma B factor antagonist
MNPPVPCVATAPPEEIDMTAYRHQVIHEVGDVTVVHFRDSRITDDLNIQELGQELFHLVETEKRKKLVLNFAAVDFLSSAALGKLITLERKIKSHNGQMKLCGIRPQIHEVFLITKLNRLFDIRNDEADALAAFQDAAPA